jgi:hypothetical protein
MTVYESVKQKYTYDRTYSSYNFIGKILYNAIESIDLPIIKPIKFI